MVAIASAAPVSFQNQVFCVSLCGIRLMEMHSSPATYSFLPPPCSLPMRRSIPPLLELWQVGPLCTPHTCSFSGVVLPSCDLITDSLLLFPHSCVLRVGNPPWILTSSHSPPPCLNSSSHGLLSLRLLTSPFSLCGAVLCRWITTVVSFSRIPSLSMARLCCQTNLLLSIHVLQLLCALYSS